MNNNVNFMGQNLWVATGTAPELQAQDPGTSSVANLSVLVNKTTFIWIPFKKYMGIWKGNTFSKVWTNCSTGMEPLSKGLMDLSSGTSSVTLFLFFPGWGWGGFGGSYQQKDIEREEKGQLLKIEPLTQWFLLS